MSKVAYTPLNAPPTRSKPGRVLICTNGECQLRLQFGIYFDGTNNNNSNQKLPTHSHSDVARSWRTLIVALLVLLLAACNRERTPGPNDTFGSSVTPMDHDPSDTFVRNVYVNGNWLGSAGTGGSIVAGGISLPHQWRPGLTAVVKWERCDRFDRKHPVPDEQACRWTAKVVPIQQYKDIWTTWLHLLPNDEVLIIPSDTGPGGDDYPGPDFPAKDFFNNTDKDKSSNE